MNNNTANTYKSSVEFFDYKNKATAGVDKVGAGADHDSDIGENSEDMYDLQSEISIKFADIYHNKEKTEKSQVNDVRLYTYTCNLILYCMYRYIQTCILIYMHTIHHFTSYLFFYNSQYHMNIYKSIFRIR